MFNGTINNVMCSVKKNGKRLPPIPGNLKPAHYPAILRAWAEALPLGVEEIHLFFPVQSQDRILAGGEGLRGGADGLAARASAIIHADGQGFPVTFHDSGKGTAYMVVTLTASEIAEASDNTDGVMYHRIAGVLLLGAWVAAGEIRMTTYVDPFSGETIGSRDLGARFGIPVQATEDIDQEARKRGYKSVPSLDYAKLTPEGGRSISDAAYTLLRTCSTWLGAPRQASRFNLAIAAGDDAIGKPLLSLIVNYLYSLGWESKRGVLTPFIP